MENSWKKIDTQQNLRNIFDAKLVWREREREREREKERGNGGSWRKWISCVFLKMLSLFEHAPINALLSNYRHSGLQLEEKGNDYHAGFVCFSVIFTFERKPRGGNSWTKDKAWNFRNKWNIRILKKWNETFEWYWFYNRLIFLRFGRNLRKRFLTKKIFEELKRERERNWKMLGYKNPKARILEF